MSRMSKLQKDALDTMKQAMEMFADAEGKLRLANRFGAQPPQGTILYFDKVFPDQSAALDSRGLNFDPEKLLPNLTTRQLGQLGSVLQGASVIVLDEEDFAVTQQVSYRYVAIRIGDTWYTSSKRPSQMDWEQLVEFIGDSRCWEVTDAREIPVEAPEVIEATPVEADHGESATLAGLINGNRKAAMATLTRMRANGKNPTPKQILDALAGLESERA